MVPSSESPCDPDRVDSQQTSVCPAPLVRSPGKFMKCFFATDLASTTTLSAPIACQESGLGMTCQGSWFTPACDRHHWSSGAWIQHQQMAVLGVRRPDFGSNVRARVRLDTENIERTESLHFLVEVTSSGGGLHWTGNSLSAFPVEGRVIW